MTSVELGRHGQISNKGKKLDFFKKYFEYVDDTEPSLLYHRWSIIASVGAMLSRHVYLPFGHDTIYPNQYIVLLGTAGSRKSTAINIATNLMKQTGYKKFASDKSSKEKFIADLAQGFDRLNFGTSENDDHYADLDDMLTEDTTISEVFIKAGELQDMLGLGSTDFISWLVNMWDNLDEYRHRTKHSDSQIIPQPTISMLGGATATTFQSMFPVEIIGSGMLSRMLLIHGDKPRKQIPFPTLPDAKLGAELVEHLKAVRALKGEVKIHPQAKELLGKIYKEWEGIPDPRLASYGSRRFTHVLKLCIVLAALRLSTVITQEDVILANTILAYTEFYMPKALGEFGKSIEGVKLDAIHAILSNASRPLSLSEIFEQMASKETNQMRLNQEILTLIGLGKVDKIIKNKKLKFFAVEKRVSITKSHTNLDLIAEWHGDKNARS